MEDEYTDKCQGCGLDVTCGVDIDGLCCACDGGGEVCDERKALDETKPNTYEHYKRLVDSMTNSPVSTKNFETLMKELETIAQGGLTGSPAPSPTNAVNSPPKLPKRDTRPLDQRLPKLADGRFWRVTKKNAIGMYEVHLREKALIGSRKLAEGFIDGDKLSDDSIVDMAKWVLRKHQSDVSKPLKEKLDKDQTKVELKVDVESIENALDSEVTKTRDRIRKDMAKFRRYNV